MLARLGVSPDERLSLVAEHADDAAVVDGPYLRVRRVEDLPGGAFAGDEQYRAGFWDENPVEQRRTSRKPAPSRAPPH